MLPTLLKPRESTSILPLCGIFIANQAILPVFIKTQQAASIVSFAKQVPGLGAAGKNENTDDQPITINSSLKELQSVDMDPYKTAIVAGVDMFMASWAVHPALDAKYPSGLSMAWIQHEL
ncbi:hypothetical protein N7467_005539 [Penicillium canescens]|nr:hypothetical protein N7467_005539 [Penicillium canescens]